VVDESIIDGAMDSDVSELGSNVWMRTPIKEIRCSTHSVGVTNFKAIRHYKVQEVK
jgi:hypothetical protein